MDDPELRAVVEQIAEVKEARRRQFAVCQSLGLTIIQQQAQLSEALLAHKQSKKQLESLTTQLNALKSQRELLNSKASQVPSESATICAFRRMVANITTEVDAFALLRRSSTILCEVKSAIVMDHVRALARVTSVSFGMPKQGSGDAMERQTLVLGHGQSADRLSGHASDGVEGVAGRVPVLEAGSHRAQQRAVRTKGAVRARGADVAKRRRAEVATSDVATLANNPQTKMSPVTRSSAVRVVGERLNKKKKPKQTKAAVSKADDVEEGVVRVKREPGAAGIQAVVEAVVEDDARELADETVGPDVEGELVDAWQVATILKEKWIKGRGAQRQYYVAWCHSWATDGVAKRNRSKIKQVCARKGGLALVEWKKTWEVADGVDRDLSRSKDGKVLEAWKVVCDAAGRTTPLPRPKSAK